MEYFLVPICFITSLFTAVAGLGGGMLLIATMPFFLPFQAVVPIHGVIQLASNLSRAAFSPKAIEWSFLKLYFVGCLIGTVLGANFIGLISKDIFLFLLGSSVLIITWLPIKQLTTHIPGGYLVIGFIQSVLSLFIGIAGPLYASILHKEDLSHDHFVVTSAAATTLVHGLKVLTFSLIGFHFPEYALLLICCVLAATYGSYVGKKARTLVSAELARKVVKILLTALALRTLFF